MIIIKGDEEEERMKKIHDDHLHNNIISSHVHLYLCLCTYETSTVPRCRPTVYTMYGQE